MDSNQHENIILAIDPGLSGGLAWRTPDRNIQAGKMPDTDGGILALIKDLGCITKYEDRSIPKVCFIEDVGGFIGKAQPGSAMFKFGFNAGFLRGLLMAFGWRVELVRPAKWQVGLGIGNSKSCDSKADWKRKLKGEAERRFPGINVTLATADALLMLDYGIKQYQNQ
jgi:hypothetical protein